MGIFQYLPKLYTIVEYGHSIIIVKFKPNFITFFISVCDPTGDIFPHFLPVTPVQEMEERGCYQDKKAETAIKHCVSVGEISSNVFFQTGSGCKFPQELHRHE